MFLTRYPQTSGLGADTSGSFDLSFLGGSAFTALILGVGIIIAAKTVFAPSRRISTSGTSRSRDKSRRSYVKYVAKQHRLSRADQAWLMEHEE